MIKSNYYVNSFSWSILAKITDSAIKFISVPWLLAYFGKDSFGIITLAIATNAYMQLLDMGVHIGAVKFFSQWIAEGKLNLVDRVSRTSIGFYGLVGLLNAFVLLIIVFFGQSWFQLTPEQFEVFRLLLIISSLFSIVNWISSVFTQLLSANEQIAYIQRITIIKSILNLLVIIITVTFQLSIYKYFLLYIMANSMMIVPYYIKSKRSKLITGIVPQKYWSDFFKIMKYSMAIFAISIFQLTATKSRPIILGLFSGTGVDILTEYRIIEVFPLFIISIGGALISIFLPKTSKMVALKDQVKMSKFAYNGTLYSSIVVALLCFPIIISAKSLLTLYVGEQYAYLSGWLVLWSVTLLLFLHNSPVASMVLATGKTKMLVISSAVSCVVSIIINALLTKEVGVGSAVIGYLVYIIIQMSFYYLYFNNRVLNINSWRVFKSFILPTLIGTVLYFLVSLIKLNETLLVLQEIFKILLWVSSYITFLFVFKLLDLKYLLRLVKNGR